MISEDVEVVNEDTGDSDENYDPEEEDEPQKETKYHYCWIKNPEYDQNKHKCKINVKMIAFGNKEHITD